MMKKVKTASGAVIQWTALHNETMNLPEVHMALGRSVVRVVLRPDGDANGADACFLQATGMQKDIVALFDNFVEEFAALRKVTNQVSNEKELRAMYRAGFRYADVSKLDDTLARLKDRGSIMMVWERK